MGNILKELQEVVDEAERQGFTVERKGGTHVALKPPDKTKAIVNMSVASSDYRTLQNVVAALRRVGFVWPVGQGIVRRVSSDSSAKLVREETPSEPPAQVLTMRIVPQPPSPPDEERVFRELKEAKEYQRLAREHAAECEARFLAAQRARDAALEECVRAEAVLREKKVEFDRAFDAA